MVVNYKGTSYKLKEEVAVKFKKGVIGVACAMFLSIGFGMAVVGNEVKNEDVEYKQVFISYSNSEYTSAVDAISDLNSGIDYRELVSFFEEKNGVASAGEIVEGMYYVPVYKGE